eukprot:scaffold7483_cov286-Pinguiococcus_pyrenoidosus.AAC.3
METSPQALTHRLVSAAADAPRESRHREVFGPIRRMEAVQEKLQNLQGEVVVSERRIARRRTPFVRTSSWSEQRMEKHSLVKLPLHQSICPVNRRSGAGAHYERGPAALRRIRRI